MTDQMANDILDVFPYLKSATLRRRVYARFSTLNQMLDIDTFKKEKEEIIGFIKRNRTEILKDKKAPIRDKAAIILLGVSYQLYRMIWKNYRNRLFNI